LKNKVLQEGEVTIIGLYAIGTSTTLESNKSQCLNPVCSQPFFQHRYVTPKFATHAAYVADWRRRRKLATQQHLQVWHRHLKDQWETPASVFDPVHHEFGITLDVCAEPHNTQCPHFFSPEMDGLVQDWGHNICWMNPPFSQVKRWLRKALDSAQAGATVICLVKHTPGVGWWRQLIPPDAEVRALGRVRFVGAKHQSPFDVALVILRPPA
jgi:site-specific DNA-methyltransferase (adenine-specific)